MRFVSNIHHSVTYGLFLGVLLIPLQSQALSEPLSADSSTAAAKQAVPEGSTASELQELERLYNRLHLEDKAISQNLRDNEDTHYRDVAVLWQAAVERSATIRYAIEKLSRKDASGQPVEDDTFTKSMLNNLARLGGVAGSLWTGSPAGLVGSNMVQEVLRDPTAPAVSPVSDADMLLLAKEVESLQDDLIQAYYRYKHARELLELRRDAYAAIEQHYETLPSMSSQLVQAQSVEAPAEEQASVATMSVSLDATLRPLMVSLLDSARQDQMDAEAEYGAARNALAMLCGEPALIALEQPISPDSSN